MATVGSLLLVLRADTAPFGRNFKSAAVDVEKFSSTLTNKLVGTVAVIGAVDSATRAVSEALSEMYFNGASAFDGLTAAGQKFVEGLQQIPIAGALGTAAATGVDWLIGKATGGPGPMLAEQLRLSAQASADAEHARKQAAGQAAINDANRDAAAIIRDTMSVQERLNAAIQRANELKAAARLTTEEHARAIEHYRAALAATKEEVLLSEAPIVKMIEALQMHRDSVGKSARELDIWKATQFGAGEAAIAVLNQIYDQIDATEGLVAAQRGVEEVFRSTRTPLEQYAATVEHLNGLIGAGLDPETYRRAIDQARSAFESAVGSRSSLLVGLGASASLSQGIRNTDGFIGRNVIDRTQDRVAQNTQKQLDLTQREIERLESIERTIRGSLTVEEVDF